MPASYQEGDGVLVHHNCLPAWPCSTSDDPYFGPYKILSVDGHRITVPCCKCGYPQPAQISSQLPPIRSDSTHFRRSLYLSPPKIFTGTVPIYSEYAGLIFDVRLIWSRSDDLLGSASACVHPKLAKYVFTIEFFIHFVGILVRMERTILSPYIFL